MERLIQGYRNFRSSFYEQNRNLFQDLARNGQSPKVLLVGCSDSRVDPAVILGAQPGDLFVLRNVANIIPPYSPDTAHHGTSAAIEFAVRVLGVEEIIVLGHAQCGGAKALMEHGPATVNSDFITGWMSIARGARDRALALTLSSALPPEVAQRICEQEIIAISMSNLMTFPWLREKAHKGELRVSGWWFDLEDGSLFGLDALTNTFIPL